MTEQLASNSVRIYRLAPEGFGTARTRLRLQSAALFVGVVVFLLALERKELVNGWRRGSIVSLLPVLFGVLLALGSLAFGFKKGVKRNQESWLSYELLIGKDFVARRIKDLPELEIQRHEITAIRENATGLRVETATKNRIIWIARALIDYEDAKERLSQWIALTKEPQRGWMTSAHWAVGITMVVLVSFATFFIATTRWIIIASGAPLLVLLTWSAVSIQKSLHVSTHTKRLSLVAILPILAIIAKLILAIIR